MQIWSTQLALEGTRVGGGGEGNEGCSLQKCSLEVYFPEAPHLP